MTGAVYGSRSADSASPSSMVTSFSQPHVADSSAAEHAKNTTRDAQSKINCFTVKCFFPGPCGAPARALATGYVFGRGLSSAQAGAP